MTVRYAYFPPGAEEPSNIFESMESVMAAARSNGDELPRVEPVTLGLLNAPSQDEILDWLVEYMEANNPTWERGWAYWVGDLRRASRSAAATLASRVNSYMLTRPGYVVDTRDLEHVRKMTGLEVVETPDAVEEEE